ncbi:hypothetical protein LWI29_020121 [Acer saccharum]|uniref:Telomerase Cajal body protein 1 n=1 Tax=Acer saccharum TaxID=4024 RepID=A0AA39RQV3_ACESA|nr:hypothetical protein LWI29_020121 [Acer saccharum]
MEEEQQQQQNPETEVVAEATEQSQQEYTWPPIRFDVPPHRTYHFLNQFKTTSVPNNFLKGVKWSPDGSCFLTSSDDNTLRVFTLPENGSSHDFNANEQDSYAADLVVSEGESVHDFCWYPYMSASDPVSCVFATTARDHPIHLWDATTGLLRCTYRAYDAVDEITAAISVAFNPAGTKIFAGYNKSVRIFDIHRPGRDFKQYSTLQGNKEGQTGIISALSFSPTHTGMLATGSYSQTSAIYNEDNMELLYILHGQEGGITHVQFSKDGNYLYTGGRKDGLVHIYDLQTGQWISGFRAAADTVNGFSFHPYLPMAASSSGHRRFEAPDDGNRDLHLTGDENCASVWSFSYASMDNNDDGVNASDSNNQLNMKTSTRIASDSNSQPEHVNLHQDP